MLDKVVRIVGVMRPFELQQQLFVYKGSEQLANILSKERETVENIMALASEYNAERVDLTGPKQYSRGIKRKLEEAEMSKYNKNTLTINIL